MSDNEKWYDEEIAPKLIELAEACRARKASFTAAVEYLPDHVGETASIEGDASFKFRLSAWATRCAGNVDSLMIAVQRYAMKHGHSSMVLKRLDVPLQPDSANNGPGSR